MKLRRAVKLVTQDGALINAALQSEVNELRNAAPKKEIIEVEKVVEKVIYKDDPSLLEKYNSAMKELGQIKNAPKNIQYVDRVIEKTVDKIIPQENVVKIVRKNSYTAAIIAALIALIVGIGLGYFGRNTDVLPSKKNIELRSGSNNNKRVGSTGK